MELLKANHRLNIPLPKKLILIRALPGLGDFLCWTPALRAIRTALPEVQIIWLGLRESAALMQRFSDYLDEWLEFPGFPGIPEVPLSPMQTLNFLQQHQLEFDLALQMHGSGAQINNFVMLLGAKQAAGFFPAQQFCPDPDLFLSYPEQEPEVWRHLQLLEFLGIPLQGDQLDFPLGQSDWQKFEKVATSEQLHSCKYICIHPGASTNMRQWSRQCFAEVADRLAAQGWQIALTGTTAEIELTTAIAAMMCFPAVNLAGKTDLGTLAALLKQAKLLICNDTGVSHLAAALQVNSVVIFTASDPDRWAPLDRQRHRVVAGRDLQLEAVLAEAHHLLQQELTYV